jgi:MOSC domain-containing protein YiiM
MARIEQVSISNGGVPKRAIPEARVTRDGLVGDWQTDRKHHGGPDRAVCLMSSELIAQLNAEGHPIAPGTTGENLTLSGIDWPSLEPGVRLRIESSEPVELEVVRYATPCKTIKDSFAGGQFERISQKTHPGESRIYTRVLQEGVVRPGDAVQVLAAAG